MGTCLVAASAQSIFPPDDALGGTLPGMVSDVYQSYDQAEQPKLSRIQKWFRDCFQIHHYMGDIVAIRVWVVSALQFV